jgi:hypothetical protein
VSAAAIMGLAASARFAVAPPTPRIVRDDSGARPAEDRGAEGFAVLFARRYLTWSAVEPDANVRGLASFAGSSMDGSLGPALPQQGEQRVEWAEVFQQRAPLAGVHVYTGVLPGPGGGSRSTRQPPRLRTCSLSSRA